VYAYIQADKLNFYVLAMIHNHSRFMTFVSWQEMKILLERSFAACMPLPIAASAFLLIMYGKKAFV